MNTSRLQIVLLVLPGAGFIFLFLAVALAMTVLQSVGIYRVVGESQFTLEFWQRLFDKSFFDSFLFSLKIGLGSAVGTLLLAYPLALFLRRRRFGASVISAIVKVPLFVPALVAAFLILNMLAFHGLLNSALLYTGIIDKPLKLLNDKFGWNVLIIEIWKNLPFQMVILASVLQTIRSDIEDAARNLGANPLQVVLHIIVPLSIPGILIAVALVFILTFGDYAITSIAGPVNPPSLPVLMYSRAFTRHDWDTAACMGLVIVLTSLLFVGLYAWMARLLQGAAR